MDKKTLAKKLAALSTEGETFEGGFRVVSDGVEPPILAAISCCWRSQAAWLGESVQGHQRCDRGIGQTAHPR